MSKHVLIQSEIDKPRLLLDMDGVIADFNRHSIRTYNEIHGTTLDEAKCDIYIGDHEVLEPSIDPKKLRAPYREVGFFLGCPPVKGAQAAVARLHQHFDIFLLTTHYWGNATCVHEKEVWLQRYFPYLASKGIFTSHKYTVKGDIFVDDRPKNLKAWKEAWPEGRTASLTYNWSDPSVTNFLEPTWEKLATKIIEAFHG
jgi:5'-nucleotidase